MFAVQYTMVMAKALEICQAIVEEPVAKVESLSL
jgi:hypothetical protein